MDEPSTAWRVPFREQQDTKQTNKTHDQNWNSPDGALRDERPAARAPRGRPRALRRLHRAHGAAALSVTRFGAQSSIPSKQEVDTFLLEQTAQGH